MNERIRLLADEAAKFSATMALPTGESGDQLFVEKFAELIIKECAGVAEISMPINSHPGDRLTVKNNVLKHFGIEE